MGDRGAQILVQPQLADFLCEALTSVRRVLTPTSAARSGSCEPQVPGWVHISVSAGWQAARPPSHSGAQDKTTCCLCLNRCAA